MVRLTCAQAIVEFFSHQESEQLDGTFEPLVYGYWGIFGHGNVCGIGHALQEKQSSVRYFRGHNEQGMGLAATAFARTKRCRQVCAVTSSIGPGATNMVTAAACAYTNRIPILFLPGDVFSTRRPHPVLQQCENFQDNSTNSVNDCFRPVSVFFDRIMRPEQLLDALPKAARALTDPVSYGPVVLALPQDLQAESFDFPPELFAKRRHMIRRLRPDASEVSTLINVVKNAAQPLIVAGGGVMYSGACDVLEEFVKSTKIPVCESQAGKGAVHDELSLGGIGVTGTQAANVVAAAADVVLVLGSRLADFVTSSNSFFAKTTIVHININHHDAHKLGGHTVVGDIKTILLLLHESLKPWAITAEYESFVTRTREDWKKIRRELCEKEFSDACVVDQVNQYCKTTKSVVVCAAGGLPGELHKMWEARHKDEYHCEYAYSCMGYEVAGGVGVKQAVGDAMEVFVLVGDGSWLMMHTEILAAVQMGIRVNVVLVDNGGFGCIHRLQQGSGIKEFGNLLTGKPRCDFVMSAQSYGCEVHKVAARDLHKALMDAKSATKCQVFVCETDPDISSPGYGWWDCAPPEVGEQSVLDARKAYDAKKETVAAKL